MKYKLLIVLATAIWGSSFFMVKDITAYVSPAPLLCVRFFVAAAVLAVVFLKHRALYFKREYVLIGLLFGAALFGGYFFQTVGAQYTTPGRSAFLTGTYCVMVPFLVWAVFHRAPTPFNIVAALLCLTGVGLLSLQGAGELNVGDALTLVGAVFYAAHLILVAHFSQTRNIFVLTMWQFAGCAIYGFFATFACGNSFSEVAQLDTLHLACLAYLAFVCTAFALLLQNVAQSHIAPTTASLLLSLESPFGVFFSILAGTEDLRPLTFLAFALVFAGIMTSEVLPERVRACREARGAAEE